MNRVAHETVQTAQRTPLYARQISALAGFEYAVNNATGQRVGEVIWPAMAQARDARLRWHESHSSQGSVAIHCGGHRYEVQFEYLDRGWVNDVRFTFVSGTVARRRWPLPTSSLRVVSSLVAKCIL